MPAGDVVMVKRDKPIEETEGGLIIPDSAKHLECLGTILHAGLAARDVMHDNGHKVGDYIRFGQYASTLDEWDYMVDEPDPNCKHDWGHVSGGTQWQHFFKCEKCGANRCKEAIALMKVEDIKVNETAEQRVRDGLMRVVRRQTHDGATQHIVQWAPYFDDQPLNNVSTHTTAQTRFTNGV
jgi:co-chaperonin GroES (HSP10)